MSSDKGFVGWWHEKVQGSFLQLVGRLSWLTVLVKLKQWLFCTVVKWISHKVSLCHFGIGFSKVDLLLESVSHFGKSQGISGFLSGLSLVLDSKINQQGGGSVSIAEVERDMRCFMG